MDFVLAKALDPLNWFEDLEQRGPSQMKLQIADRRFQPRNQSAN